MDRMRSKVWMYSSMDWRFSFMALAIIRLKRRLLVSESIANTAVMRKMIPCIISMVLWSIWLPFLDFNELVVARQPHRIAVLVPEVEPQIEAPTPGFEPRPALAEWRLKRPGTKPASIVGLGRVTTI
jgi:hypothetical protein